MTVPIGLVAGTVFYRQDFFCNSEPHVVQTPFGPATILRSDRWAYVPRHGLEGEQYLPPHRINHQANLSALKALGVTEVIGVNSCGSLRPSLGPGSVVLPSDYICLGQIITIFEDRQVHITPVLNETVRAKLKDAAQTAGVHLVEGGVYWQTHGPRLETKAEIRLQSQFADMVGMTMANEATIAQELELSYASICSVDNLAHGLSPIPLSSEEILGNAAINAQKIIKIIESYPR
ncbi:MAG: MTAP family purine nucleoside phosphorylase [Deltaproteobacteria bacterium]|nr:MTAP family purine nucleoside phosphorylase [Deltaproteobacteria bacterium]